MLPRLPSSLCRLPCLRLPCPPFLRCGHLRARRKVNTQTPVPPLSSDALGNNRAFIHALIGSSISQSRNADVPLPTLLARDEPYCSTRAPRSVTLDQHIPLPPRAPLRPLRCPAVPGATISLNLSISASGSLPTNRVSSSEAHACSRSRSLTCCCASAIIWASRPARSICQPQAGHNLSEK